MQRTKSAAEFPALLGPEMPLVPALHPSSALFLDLDGTLLETAPRPELVRVPAELPDLLPTLAQQRGGALAVISGRSLTEIDNLLDPWHGAAAGVHGAERRRTDGRLLLAGASPADQAAAQALAALRPALTELAERNPGTWLEDKGRTLALHYRAAPQSAEALRAGIESLMHGHQALRLIAGKMVFELQPRHHNKGCAIAAFMAEPPFTGRMPVFVGDDTTDEDGFREVNRRGGISIRVGPAEARTAARCTLPSVRAVLAWLDEAARQP